MVLYNMSVAGVRVVEFGTKCWLEMSRRPILKHVNTEQH